MLSPGEVGVEYYYIVEYDVGKINEAEKWRMEAALMISGKQERRLEMPCAIQLSQTNLSGHVRHSQANRQVFEAPIDRINRISVFELATEQSNDLV